MIKLFIKYVSIGVLNTALHWAIFALCVYGFQTSQALANVAGFAVAVSFSFFANARFTFGASVSTGRYLLYVGFMGVLNAVVGWTGDKCAMPPIFTLIVFSAISLICGFLYSRFIVFRNEK
ncbi:GtrA family protein [Salmonella enterica]|nr:GtrA family protein [Salmonella enterica]EEK5125947.1 GtrA family protein [Salmonella enterica subsp. enterica serovar Infantis]